MGYPVQLLVAICLVLLLTPESLGQRWRKRRNEVDCQPLMVPMCKGLVPYTHTHLPNGFGHRDQAAAYWALQQYWPYMDLGCSKNLRLYLCALYLPKCDPATKQVQLPCRKTCRKAQVRCSEAMKQQGLPWPTELDCDPLLQHGNGTCVGPAPERREKKYKFVSCVPNEMSLCASVPYPLGSLPNTFLQANQEEMELEMQQYRALIQTGCSPDLQFFLCGVFMPYCVQNAVADIPFGIPCRGVCERVYHGCYPHWRRLTKGLPWPGKFHCHRYPRYQESFRWDNRTIPCVQRPNPNKVQ